MATVTTDHEARNKAALKLIRAEKAKAAKIAANEEMNISTRSRQALKIRSDVVDPVEAALTGKSAKA